MTEFVDYLIGTPILLIPLLVVAAMVVVAVLKKLLRLALVLVVAGVLYALLVEYSAGGM